MKNTLNSFIVANPKKCIGCKACEVACFAVHNDKNNVGAVVGTVTTPIIPRLYTVRVGNVTMPVQCRHCENAPCANSCPVGAITQEENSIHIDEKKCIGCKGCVLVCPFGAIEMLPQYECGQQVVQNNLKEDGEDTAKIVAYKCDLCKENGQPACIKACPKDALKLVTPSNEKKNRNLKAAKNLIDTLKNFN